MVFLGWRCHDPSAILIKHGLELSYELGCDLSHDLSRNFFLIKQSNSLDAMIRTCNTNKYIFYIFLLSDC
jgi:hypothetical protein